ncbi:MAG: hypothetical protein JWO72_1210 [Caulobacteraceae bacterium]|nr:hypothetical protein [Caulobacteraceae bacterium]
MDRAAPVDIVLHGDLAKFLVKPGASTERPQNECG